MSVDLLLILPILVPLIAAMVTIFLRNAPRSQQGVSIASMAVLLGAAVMLLARLKTDGILVTELGDWPAPFGITLVGDHLSIIMLLISAVIGIAGVVYSVGDIQAERGHRGFHSFLNVMMAGVCGCILAGDLFNLYVWFEVLLIASFVLMVLGSTKEQLEGSIKYVVLSLIASSLLLAGVGMIYGMTGTLNLADLATHLRQTDAPQLVTAVSGLFIVAVGLKAALFPFFFWLPASYHTPPVTVSAIFAGLLTKVAVYVLIRLFTLLFVAEVGYTHTILLWLAGFTMVTGVLGAAVAYDFRRILSFHIISQIGYMIMGLALFTPLALVGAIYFLVHNVLAKTNLFFVSGIAHGIGGSFHLKKLGGLYRYQPFLSVLFLIPALSLAGIPPLSGFFGKLILARAGFEVQEYLIVGVALAVGLMTLYSMSKIWVHAFLEPTPEADSVRPDQKVGILYVPVVFLVLLTVAISIHPAPLVDLATSAADELTNTDRYINAVLNR